MSASEHQHEWVVGSAPHELRCACGANLWAIQEALDAAADGARRVAGESYYTGCRIRGETNTVGLYLASAPEELLEEIEALHPGVYVIHNNAAHTLSELLELRDSIDLLALKSRGINVTRIGPRNDGYIWVGVNTDISAARAWFETEYGGGLFRVFAAEPAVALSLGHVEPV